MGGLSPWRRQRFRTCDLDPLVGRLVMLQPAPQMQPCRRPHVNVCCLDSRIFPSVTDIISIIKKVHTNAGGCVVYFIGYPTEDPRLATVWSKGIMKNFDNAVYYGTEAHERVGLSIMMLGQFAGNTTLSDVVFMEPPLDMGHVVFGKAMCYVEFQFSNPPKTSNEAIGVLWAPHLFCIAKPWFNETNYQGAITFMMNVVAWNMHDRRDDGATELTSQAGNTQAIEVVNGLRTRLSGLLVLTDMRSESFAGKWALHQWNVSGGSACFTGSLCGW